MTALSSQHSRETPVLRFDFADSNGRPRAIRFSRPLRILQALCLDEVKNVLDAVETGRRSGLHAAGFVSYEAAPAFDRALVTQPPAPGQPLAWFGLFDRAEPIDGSPSVPPSAPDFEWTAEIDPARFDIDVARIRRAIEEGDVYQVNYTFRISADLGAVPPAVLYERLLADHRPPYAAYLELDGLSIVSLSPELFFRIEGRRLVSAPMKGTAPRGSFAEDDHTRGRALAESTKDRAENVMIVDLVRNDLSRVAEPGTVRVPSLYSVERYASVWQMTSTVEGRLRPGTTIGDVFGALFPAGSITGAPKSSAMRAIADLEGSPRGIYTGALGYVEPTGDATFNVAIRTWHANEAGRATAGIGGGITWESDAQSEFAEALDKAGFLRPVPTIDLFETMRLEDGEAIRLERHVSRLAESADYFGFAYHEPSVRSAVDLVAREHAVGTHRLRLTLSRDGHMQTAIEPMPHVPAAPPMVALAASPVSSENRWLYHKTTHRRPYERARSERPAAFDVLLWNERGEITEFTIGNVVIEIDGQLLTPPRQSGLLAGVMRQELLERGLIVENTIGLDVLGRASRAWLINSLRGWVEVRLPGPDPDRAGT
jgi:para-aminobenzoate synthetase/4-amino-4-deoxychorismate lyase